MVEPQNSAHVHKQSPARYVLDAIRQVLAGEQFLSPKLMQLMNRSAASGSHTEASEMESLTDRELGVFSLLGRGLRTSEIAEQMNVSSHTIDSYRERLKFKLKLKTAAELARQVIRWSLQTE